MFIKDFIKIYDNVLKPETSSSFIKWLEDQNFIKGSIGIGEINKEVRNTEILSLLQWDKTMTHCHWCNLITFLIKNKVDDYVQRVAPKLGIAINGFNAVDVLKYGVGGHYAFHIDTHTNFPRQLSCILMLNNDYVGGKLRFADTISVKPYLEIEAAVGRLVIWPSGFMYPHSVTPVTEGKRYSVVAWAN